MWKRNSEIGSRNLGWARLVFQLPPSDFRFFNIGLLFYVNFSHVNTLQEKLLGLNQGGIGRGSQQLKRPELVPRPWIGIKLYGSGS